MLKGAYQLITRLIFIYCFCGGHKTYYFNKYDALTLRAKCPYLKFFWSAFSRIRTEYKGKLFVFRTRITPNMDTFCAVQLIKLPLCKNPWRLKREKVHTLITNCNIKTSIFREMFLKIFYPKFRFSREIVPNTLRKIPKFHLISCCANFVERPGFRIVSGNSAETL